MRNSSCIITLVAALALFLLAGCQQPQAEAPQPGQANTPSDKLPPDPDAGEFAPADPELRQTTE